MLTSEVIELVCDPGLSNSLQLLHSFVVIAPRVGFLGTLCRAMAGLTTVEAKAMRAGVISVILSNTAATDGAPREAADVTELAFVAAKVDVAWDSLDFGRISAATGGRISLDKHVELVGKARGVVTRGGVQLGPDVVHASEWLKEKSQLPGERGKIFILREIGDLKHHSRA